MTNQPQWIGLYGALRAELEVRRRDLTGAQAAVQEALDRLEVCTDDVMGIARMSCIGLWVEADRAERARDLRETGERRDALARARLHADRLAATAQDGGPVERARLAQGKAELARARGRGAAQGARAAAACRMKIERRIPRRSLCGARPRRWPRPTTAPARGDRRRRPWPRPGAGSQWLVREVGRCASAPARRLRRLLPGDRGGQ